MEDFKYNYFTVYLTERLENSNLYRFFKKGVECFTDSNSVVYKSDTLITTEEFVETVIKGTMYSSISSKISTSDLKERIGTLLEEVSVLNKQAKNQKVIIDWDEFPLVTKPELREEMLNKLNKFTETTNIPMKEVENSLFNAFMWLNVDSYITKDGKI
jgi:hypothetical protein